jgi:copper/silver efflux system protein
MPTSPFDPEVTAAGGGRGAEVARPLLTSAATTIIGFLPIFALTDQAGRLFTPLALTKTIAISGAVLFGTCWCRRSAGCCCRPWHVRKPLLLALAGGHRRGRRVRLVHSRRLEPADGIRPLGSHAFRAGSSRRCLPRWWRARCGGSGRERLVNYEENPTSHAIHVAYNWAYVRILRTRSPSPW